MRLTRSFRTRRPGLLAETLKIRLSVENLEVRTMPDAGALSGLLTVVQPHAVPSVVATQGKTDHLPPPPAPPNVLVNSPTEDGTSRQDTQSETSLVVAGNTIITGFNDSNLYSGSSNHFTGYSRSTNGGTSFTDLGGLPNVSGGDAGDPVLARDSVTGRVYLSTLSFTGSNINIFRSDDNFQTALATTILSRSGGALDKEWMTVDNAPGAGQGSVYLIVRDFGSGNGIYLYKSTDHGATFPGAGVQIVSGSTGNVQGAWVATGPDHAVYAVWFDNTTSTQSIKMRKSTDGGTTFGAAVTITTLRTTGVNGDLGLGNFRSNAFPQLLVNPTNANQVYVVYDDKGVAANDRADVYFRLSNDGGATWGAAVKLNDDTTTRDQWQASLAVTPDGQHLGVFWYDRRLDTANTMIDRFGVVGTVAGNAVNFGTNQRVSDTSFPVVVGQDPVVNGVYMGDYDQAAADNNFFYVNWGDNRDVAAWSSSAHNANVRFAKVPVVVSANANHYTIDAPASVFVGDTFSITVTAANGNGQPDPSYRGTVHFTSTDQAAGLPDDYTFTAGDAGVHTFDGLSLNTPGNQTITGTDVQNNTITGAAAITVFRVGASHFTITGPAATITGQPFTLTVQATMDDGTVDPNYQGTVTFSSTDQSAGLPADYTFTSDDAGVHTFTGVTLSTLGTQRITGTDTQDNTITGTISILVTAPTLFQPHVDYNTGPAPTSVAVGDFNGDGILDLAVCNQGTAPNYTDGSVTILLGNGDGTFTVAGTFPAGIESNAISTADFNGDGILDLVVANFGVPGTGAMGDVSVLYGNGDGTFQPAVHLTAGTGPSSAESADLNFDGFPDIIVANNLSNNVSVFINNGDGTFQPAVNYAAGTHPVEVAIADYNLDGIPDLAVVNQVSNNITILNGNGDGTFTFARNIAVGAGAQSVFTADLNFDGIPDLVTANFSAGTISVLLGNGDGTFQPPVSYTVGSGPSEVEVDYFTSNGIPDIVVTNSNSNTISVLLGNGDGTFQPQVTYATGAQPWFVTSADFNFDGYPDLVVVDVLGNGVSVLLNTAFFGPAVAEGSVVATDTAAFDSTLTAAHASRTDAVPVASPAQRAAADALDAYAVDQYLGVALSGANHASPLQVSRLLTRSLADGWFDLLRPDELFDL